MLDNKKEKFIINTFTQTILSLGFFEIVKLLSEDFFQVLLGLKKAYKIDLEIELIKKIQVLIYYLRLIGGLELYLTKIDNNFYFISIDDNFSKSIINNKFISYREFANKYRNDIENINIQSDFKNRFLDCIYNRRTLKIKSNIENIIIFTHNRPHILKKTIEEYINNFEIFAYTNIKIIVSDDSDKEFYLKNKEILEKINYDIEHIYLDYKDNIVDELKTKYTFNKESLDYIFGTGIFKQNIARNRNFISFLFRNKEFISIDDDSRPLVLTYSLDTVNKAIESMFIKNDFELININNYINYNKKIFLPVNFIGNFSNYDQNTLKFVKYSGIEDDSIFYQLAKLFSYYLDNKNEILNIITFTEKFMDKKTQGLCLYFPDKENNYKFTIPEAFRLEDTIIGINYYNETSKYPISSNFSIYHNKDINIKNIKYSDFKNEIISTFIFLLYENTFLKNIENYSYINISDEIFNKVNYEINLTYNLFIKYHQFFKNKDNKISNFIANILNYLKVNFIDFDYRKDIENYINNIFFHYFNSYNIWKIINSS